MKKIFLLPILLLITSCQGINGYCDVTQWKQQEAQSMYNSFGTTLFEMTPEEASKTFGSCYYKGDDIYVYKTLWGKKFILARYGKAVTYVEGDAYDARQNKNNRSNYYNNSSYKSYQSNPNQPSNSQAVQWF